MTKLIGIVYSTYTMDEIIRIFKKNAIRVTPQRAQIYRIFLKNNSHLTAEEIYEKIKTKLPTISLATIYTVLELFRKKHLVSEIRIQFDKSCFEARNDFHHHFLCRKCKKIFDIDINLCPALTEKEFNGHHIEELQGYFYGTCKNCKR